LGTVWHTRAGGETDADGLFRFRGFFGDYRAAARVGGRAVAGRLCLRGGGGLGGGGAPPTPRLVGGRQIAGRDVATQARSASDGIREIPSLALRACVLLIRARRSRIAGGKSDERGQADARPAPRSSTVAGTLPPGRRPLSPPLGGRRCPPRSR